MYKIISISKIKIRKEFILILFIIINKMSGYLNTRILYSIFVYLLIMLLIFVKKPKLMYDDNNQIKSFGTGKNETIYSLGVVSLVIAVIVFYIFCLIDMIFK